MEISNIIALRIRVSDPSDYIEIKDVDSVPSDADKMTAYRTGENKYFDSEGNRISILLSDSMLNTMIEENGIDEAEVVAFQRIVSKIGVDMRIVKISHGTDSTQFQTLSELYSFYNNLAKDAKAMAVSKTKETIGKYVSLGKTEIYGGFPL